MSAPLRLRCPADTDPARHDEHLAVDVRLPVALDAAAAVAAGLPRCPCGAKLWIDTRPVEPPADMRDARIAELTDALRDAYETNRSDYGRASWCMRCGASWGTEHDSACPVGRALRVLGGGDR